MNVHAGRLLRLLCLVVLALQASLLFRSPERLAGPPLSADSRYALAVARDIAGGRGVDVVAARYAHGFQPLFTLLCAALYRISGDDPIPPLRLLLLLHLAIHLATALLLAAIARAVYRDLATLDRSFETNGDAAFGWLVAFLYLVAVGTFLQHYDGLETGLGLLLVALAWRLYQRRAGETMANALSLGLVFGFAMLTRVDAALLLVVVCAGELLRKDFDRIDAVRRVAIIGAMAICVASPWWFYNLVTFGSLAAPGGTPLAFRLSPGRIEEIVSAGLADAVPWIYSREGVITTLARLAVLVAALLGLPRGTRVQPWLLTTVIVDRTRRFAIYLLAFTAVLAIGYAVSSPATQLYVRDLAALDPCATLVVAFGAWRFSRHSAAVAAALGVGLVLGMGLVVQALHHGRAFDRSVIYAVAAAPRHAVAPSAGGVVSIRGARHRNPSCPSDLRVRLMACSVRGENHGPPLLDTVERRATSESP